MTGFSVHTPSPSEYGIQTMKHVWVNTAYLCYTNCIVWELALKMEVYYLTAQND